MRQLIKLILKLVGFWLLLFFVQRCIFMWWGIDNVQDLSISDFFESHQHAMAMDLSMTAYILILPVLFMIARLFIRPGEDVNWKGLRFYFIFIVFISAFIHIGDLGLFTEWGNKMNRKVMSYFAFPDKVLVSTLSAPILLLVSILVIQVLASIWMFKRYISERVIVKSNLIGRVTFSILLVAAVIIGIRGGLQELPLKKSSVYFSRHNMLNLASLNSTWNFMELVIKKKEPSKNPYQYFEPKDASKTFAELNFCDQDFSLSISKIASPNIVMILLESWSGDVIAPLGGETDVTPQFTKLCEEGLIFKNFYSTGFRTEQGQAALISGFPSQPTTAIMRSFGKFNKLPGLPIELKKANYHSVYYYTGDLEYANMGKYLYSTGFDQIFGEEDFEFEKKTYWGAYDEELFDFNLEHMSTLPRPFFSLMMTSTSHEPFDAPVKEGFDGTDPPDLYRNTVHYTDRMMGKYIEDAKEKDWYENTLIFIVSDHAHRLPKNRKRHEAERHRIPFLITGGALRDDLRGAVKNRVSSHIDFPATILGQLGLSSERFKYSKNLFNPDEPAFAFYAFEEGFGWIEDDQCLIYDHQLGEVVSQNDSLPSIENQRYLRNGKVYLQTVMQDYVDY